MNPAPQHPIPDEILDAASVWLARRDRGLTPGEQDEYMHWLGADPRHPEALARHAAALERMMQLYEWTPAHDTEPNPDLFAAPARRVDWWRWAGLAFAAAAAVAVGLFVWSPGRPAPTVAAAPKSHLLVNERLALPDGSRVELKDGTQLVVQYSDKERRVKLTGGEAHFSVWKDARRPFIVDAAGVEVRAVGTAFNVRLEAGDVQVLVTEGRVKVEPAPPAVPDGRQPVAAPAFVSVGQRVVVPRPASTEVAPAAVAPVITTVTPEEIARELAWQAPRLQFDETPLAQAIAEFNRLNRHQLELGDAALGSLRIGGTFRPDNVEGFIRLLSTDPSFPIRAEPAGDNRTILRRR